MGFYSDDENEESLKLILYSLKKRKGVRNLNAGSWSLILRKFFPNDSRNDTKSKRKRNTRLILSQFKDKKKSSYSEVSPRGEQSAFLKACQGKSIPKKRQEI